MSVDVSVVIAAYNAQDTIAAAIESALSQEDVCLEVIVVDDCSHDGTVDVVEGIDDLRLSLLCMAKNGGAGAARNLGFAAAVGEWIAVLDSDDVFAPGRLKRCVDRARSAKADIVVDNKLVDRGDDQDMEEMYPAAEFETLSHIDLAQFVRGRITKSSRYTLGYLKPLFSATFLRRHELSYDAELTVGEDYMLFADALAHGAVCAVEYSKGYVYSVREGSLSHRLLSDNVERMLRAESDFLARYDLPQNIVVLVEAKIAVLRQRYVYALLVEAIKVRDLVGAFAAIKLNPRVVLGLWRPVWFRVAKYFYPGN